MKILITGGAGFLGSHLTGALAKSHDVAVMDNMSNAADATTGISALKARLHRADIMRDSDEILAKEGPEIVYHYAAQVNPRASVEKPLHDLNVNVSGTLSLLEACRKADVKKIIYASTCAVFGEPRQLPVGESHVAEPTSQYGASKLCAEHYIRLYERLYGIPYTIFRYPNIFGPGQNASNEAGVVSIFMNAMLRNERPVIYGDGSQTRDYLYVENIIQPNIAAISKADNETLNIGTGIETSVNRAFELIKNAMDFNGNAMHADERKGDMRRMQLSAERAKELLGFEPSVTLEQGIKKTAEYYKEKISKSKADRRTKGASS